MVFDFSKPMTSYEMLALSVASLALFMPFIRQIIRKICFPLKLSFIPQDNSIRLLFNESGPYAIVGFSLHCQNKPILLKNIKLLITRKTDNAQLSLIWSVLQLPTSQQLPDGNFIFLRELARPLQIAENTLHLFRMDFSNTNLNVLNKLDSISVDKMLDFEDLDVENVSYENAVAMFKSQESYSSFYDAMLEELFWKAGEYEFFIAAHHDNEKVFVKKYSFSINEIEYKKFKENIETSLLCRLNKKYGKINSWHSLGAVFKEIA